MIPKMNYSQKRTLVGRVIYIALTLMAVTVLCVTMFTFFGGSKRNDPPDNPVTGSGESTPAPSRPDKETDAGTGGPVTDRPAGNLPPESDIPTNVPPAKDWSKLKVMMPVEGRVYKRHDLVNAVYSLTMNDYRIHQGIDLSCAEGAEVFSCAYGTVKAVGNDPFMGRCIVIDHGDGLVSYYKNLSEGVAEGISEGATVYAGQKIGTVGESAIIEISDDPHLHFELLLNDKPIDPLTMLDYKEPASDADSDS